MAQTGPYADFNFTIQFPLQPGDPFVRIRLCTGVEKSRRLRAYFTSVDHVKGQVHRRRGWYIRVMLASPYTPSLYKKVHVMM